MKSKSSDECLKILIVTYYDNEFNQYDKKDLNKIYKGMYQLEEK